MISNKNFIISDENQWVKLCKKLIQGNHKDRKNFFIIEGLKSITSLLAKHEPEILLTTEKNHNETGVKEKNST